MPLEVSRGNGLMFHILSHLLQALYPFLSSGLSMCKSTRWYFSSRRSSGETYSDRQQVVDIKCHYWAIHTPPCLCPLFTGKCWSFSHSSWPCSQHVSPFKGHRRLWQFSDFCQRMVRVMIYQAPPINFSSSNDGHESCYTLTAPFLTNADLCMHFEWLIC